MIAPAALAQRRANGRRRWHRWAARQKARRALCWAGYDGVVLAKLIEARWLPRSREDAYTTEQIGAAITDLLAHAELPAKKF
jgi:hypothetical protein